MINKTLVSVFVPAFLVGLLANAGFGWLGSSQQSPSSEKGVGKVVEDKDEEPVEPEPPEDPVYDPPMETMCGDVNTTSAGAESALFTHMAGRSSYGRHDSMLDAAVRIPLMFDTREGAAANYRTTPQLGMSTMADPDGRSRVALQFHIKTIDATVGVDVFKPSALEFSHDYSAHYIYSDGNGTLRQLLTDDTLTDVTLLGAGEEGYLIRSYRRADQVGAFDPNLGIGGEYPVTGQPYLESKVYNPNPLTYNGNIKVQVTERFSSGPDFVKINSWGMDPATNSTTFEELHPDSTGIFYPLSKTVLLRTALTGEDYEQTREKHEPLTVVSAGFTGAPALAVVSRDYEKYTFIGGEKRLVQLKTAVTAAGANTLETITTDYTYYAPSNNGYNTGRPDTVVRSDGMWWKYQYSHIYSSGLRVFKMYTPFGNTPISSYQQGRKESVFVSGDSYTKYVHVAGQEVSKEVQVSSIVNNKLVIKTERGHSAPGGPLVSYTAFNRDSSQNLTENRLHSRVNEDGTVELYAYADLGNGNNSYSETIQSGAGTYDSNGIVTSVTSGSEAITLYNANGMAYEYSSKHLSEVVANNGLELDSWSAIEPVGGPNPGTLHTDDFGRPTKKFYNGNLDDVATWDYSCCGYEETTTRAGAITTYERDLLKRIVSVVRKNSGAGAPIETTTQYAGLTTTVEETAGGVTLLGSESTRSLGGLTSTSWTPDADGQVSSAAATAPAAHPNAEYNRLEVVFNSAGQGVTTQLTHPDGTSNSTFTYCDGTTHSTTDQGGHETVFEYGIHNEQGGGIWTKETSPIASQWIKTYSDSLGREFRVEFADGSVKTKEYHSASAPAGSCGRIFRTKDADENSSPGEGEVFSYAYSAEGTIATVSQAIAGGATRVTATAHDVVASAVVAGKTISPAIRETVSVNGVGVKQTLTSIDGYTRGVVELKGESLTTKTVPVDGEWTIVSVNPSGQSTVSAYVDGSRSNESVFANNVDIELGDPAYSSSFEYDLFGWLVQKLDSRTGPWTVVSRLDNGLVSIVEQNNGSDQISYVYDPMGRELATILPDGSEEWRSYTQTGRIKAAWGSRTLPRLYKYDSLDRVSELRTFQGLTFGVEPTETTANFSLRTWHYDPLRGWLIEKNYHGETGNGPGGVADFAYTSSGRVKTRTWERGVGTSYTYEHGFLNTVTYSNDSTGTKAIGYTYDSWGRPQTVTQGGNQHAYTYDPNTQVLDFETVSYDTDANGTADFSRVVDLDYNAFLRDMGFSLKNGTVVEHGVSHTYDESGRLHTVSSQGDIFTYEYEQEAPGLIKSVTGPKHKVVNTYEPFRDALDAKANVYPDGTTLHSHFDYTVNAIAQFSDVVTSGSAFSSAPSFVWKHSGAGELEEADDTSSGNNDRAFVYDGAGNRTTSVEGLLSEISTAPTVAYASNSNDQYTLIGTLVPSYDADGNATAYPLATTGGQLGSLVWDAENRLVSAMIGGVETKFSYDYLGRRISKKVGANPAVFSVYMGETLIARYDGPLLESYVWGKDMSGSRRGAGGAGGLLMANIGDSSYYPTYDGNGNVSEYLDSSGTVAAHFEYDAFGNTTIESVASGAPTFVHRFSTKPYDPGTGLYDFGFRLYECTSGKWLSRDPVEEWGGINLYRFVRNDPIDFVDVDGLAPDGMDGEPWKVLNDAIKKQRAAKDKAIEDFNKWHAKETTPERQKELEDLPACPCKLKLVEQTYWVWVNGPVWGRVQRTRVVPCPPDEWELVPDWITWYTLPKYHPGGHWDMRTRQRPGKPGQQCVFDENGDLINNGPGAGTPDARGPGGSGFNGHGPADVKPYEDALRLDGSKSSAPNINGEFYKKYMEARPPSRGKDENGKPCPENPKN